MSTISVIVPVYNVEPYLHRCIDSILAQTYTDFELILVDDGSPDNCGAICDEYAAKDNRIHVIHQDNSGLSAARNAGIDWAFANSDSEWIAFVDSDDWIDLQYLEALNNGVQKNNADIACCSRKEIDDESQTVLYTDNLSNEIISSREALHRLVDENWLTYNYTWNKLYKKTLFEGIRFPNGKNYEDVFVMHELYGLCHTICIISLPGYFYRIRPDSIMRAKIGISALTNVEGFCARFAYYFAHGFIEEANSSLRMALEKYFIYYDQLEFLGRKEKSRLRQVQILLFNAIKLNRNKHSWKTIIHVLIPKIYIRIRSLYSFIRNRL